MQYDIRSDLLIEALSIDTDGIVSDVRNENNLTITTVDVIDEDITKKKKGKYITIEFNNINSDKSSINGFSGDNGKLIANALNLLNLDYKIDLKFIDGFELNDIIATSPSDSIQITITTKANNQPIILKSYSYNIGEPLIESLVIPPPQP